MTSSSTTGFLPANDISRQADKRIGKPDTSWFTVGTAPSPREAAHVKPEPEKPAAQPGRAESMKPMTPIAIAIRFLG